MRRSPFADTAPSIVTSIAWGLAVLVWAVAGGALVGGRWFAVHLFTLGVLTNVVLAFTEHFGCTLTRTRATAPAVGVLVGANAGAVLTLFGMATGERWAVGGGATVLTVAVTASYVRLRRMRKAAVGARFAWVVRVYERAHGAFIHGALLGLLMGVGLLRGGWYGSARLAHLHVNILGWGGLTLLATIVFFGPTIVRTRIVEGADDVAARSLRRAATGLTVGVLLLLATGAGVADTAVRWTAAAGFAVYAAGVTATCIPVARAARDANPAAGRWPVVAVSLWFPLVAWADVAVVATGTWRLLDALGLAMAIGVLAQAVVAVVAYLLPMLLAPTGPHRQRLLERVEHGATTRAVAWNLATAAIVLASAARIPIGATVWRAGLAALVICLASLAVAGLAPVRSPVDA